MVINWTANFVGLLLVPAKLHVDALNNWQYRVVRNVYKVWAHILFLREKSSTKKGCQEKLHHKFAKTVHFQDAFAMLYMIFMLVDLSNMHACGTVKFWICLAPKHNGNSISG